MTSRTKEKRCKWCKNPFTVLVCRQTNAVKYCSDKCRDNAKREQNLEAQYRYQKRYKWLFKDADKRGSLGESRIGGEASENFDEEYKKVHDELMRRIKCKTK